MARLTLQDKLALSLTSAGSARKLAAAIGVSPRAMGRYLKGERDIPDELRGAINQTFSIHKTISLQQAEVLRIPMDAQAPVFVDRPLIQVEQRGFKLSRTGAMIPTIKKARAPGQRLFVTNTQHLSTQLRGTVARQVLTAPSVGAVTARRTGSARQLVRSKVSGFRKFKSDIKGGQISPRKKMASYTEYASKFRANDIAATVSDLQAKVAQHDLPVDTLVFTLPRTPDQPDLKPRKRSQSARKRRRG
jgi:hypothetical protein